VANDSARAEGGFVVACEPRFAQSLLERIVVTVSTKGLVWCAQDTPIATDQRRTRIRIDQEVLMQRR